MTQERMSADDYEKYFSALELGPSATLPEVRDKYYSLKSLYSADLMELAALNLDLSDDRVHSVLEQLEEAYAQLTHYFENKDNDSYRKEILWLSRLGEIRKYAEDVGTFSGPVLKDIRERFGVELRDMAEITRIGRRQLENIEAELFSNFEAEVYLQGYVAAYAGCLSLDPQKVSADYMDRYRAWKSSATDGR